MVFGLPRWTWIDRVRESMIASPLGKKTHIYIYIYICLVRNANSKLLEMIVLPRQARDKRRESTHNQSAVVFSLFSGRDMFTSVGQRMFPLPLSAPYHPSMLDPKVRARTHSSLFAVILLRDTIILPRQARDKHDEISKR
eukprot:COSAG06_NODE_6976_length_2690_cov_1.906986_1_plen_140_part_00